SEPVTFLYLFNDLTVELVVLRLLDSRLAVSVRIAEANYMRRQCLVRVTSLLVFAPMETFVFWCIRFRDFWIVESLVYILGCRRVEALCDRYKSSIVFLSVAELFRKLRFIQV